MKPMRRTGFKSPKAPEKSQQDREQRLMQRAQAAMKIVATRAAVIAPISSAPAPAALKVKPWRSEAYRRAVASLPCICCGIAGYSQHAHENDGKGARMKVDDRRAMPLCCTRPGIEGCHAAFDGYHLLPGGREAHHAQGRAWAAQTRKTLTDTGLWPKSVPLWQKGASDD